MKGYFHGDLLGKRVVVLSEKTARELQNWVTWTDWVISLKDELLRCVEAKRKLSEATDDAVLLRVLCH